MPHTSSSTLQTHGGAGECLVYPLTHVSASLSRGDQGEPGASLYTCKRLSFSLLLSLAGARAKAWCLLIHV